MKRFLLYGHGGCANHGAEAILYCTIALLKKKYPDARIFVSTHFARQDKSQGIQADEFIEADAEILKEEKRAATWEEKEELDRRAYTDALNRIDKDTVLLSIGGDNYCYDNWHRLAVFQKKAKECGAGSILWSASIDPAKMTAEMAELLHTYDVITARESLTLQALWDHKIRAKTVLIPDIAFRLPVKNKPANKKSIGK